MDHFSRPVVCLSLGFGIQAILQGKIREEDVIVIISDTGFTEPWSDETREELLESYCQTYWRESPAKALGAAERLIRAGRVQQTKLGMERDRERLRFLRWYQGHADYFMSDSLYREAQDHWVRQEEATGHGDDHDVQS